MRTVHSVVQKWLAAGAVTSPDKHGRRPKAQHRSSDAQVGCSITAQYNTVRDMDAGHGRCSMGVCIGKVTVNGASNLACDGIS